MWIWFPAGSELREVWEGAEFELNSFIGHVSMTPCWAWAWKGGTVQSFVWCTYRKLLTGSGHGEVAWGRVLVTHLDSTHIDKIPVWTWARIRVQVMI